MPKPRVVIRLATQRDAPALTRVFRDAYGPIPTAAIRRWMRSKDCRKDFLVAVVDGVVASSVNIQYRELLIDGVPIRTGGIAGVATHGAYRHRGLATRLMKEALRRIRDRGVSNASLFTGFNLPAIRIYRRFGYSEVSAWRSFEDVRRPMEWMKGRFAFRGRWLRTASYGKRILDDLNRRVLIETPAWRATVSLDGRTFKVRAGRRGRPDVVMRGAPDAVFSCFGDHLIFDRLVRQGKLRVTGAPDAVRAWRMLLTLRWRG